MSNSLILCEGETDQITLGLYLECVSGWKYDDKVESRFPDEPINWYKRGNDLLGIWRMGGCDFNRAMAETLKRESYVQEFGRIAIVTDNDSDEEFKDRFIEILVTIRELAGFDQSYKLEEQYVDTWNKVSFVDKSGAIGCVEVCIIPVPIDEQGAMETFIINSFSDNLQEGEMIVKESGEFVDSIVSEVYLRKRRDRIKAKMGVSLSVFNPDKSFRIMKEILNGIRWHEFERAHRQFERLEEL